MLETPVWRFCSLVEHWIWANTKEEDQAELSRELDRDVDFTWANTNPGAPIDSNIEPSRWQQNQPGESLLSAHR